MRPCPKCGVEFEQTSATNPYCEQCDRDYKRNYNFLRNYGISFDEYVAWWNRIDGRCEACGEFRLLNPTKATGKPDRSARLHVDHDHAVNEPHARGLLCKDCNVLAGWIEKDFGRIQKVTEYLNNRSNA